MNGVTDRTAYLHLLVAGYRRGWIIILLCLQAKFPSTLSLLLNLDSFYCYSLHFVQRSHEVQGENWREQTSRSYCHRMCFQRVLCCLCLLLLFPLLTSDLFSD